MLVSVLFQKAKIKFAEEKCKSFLYAFFIGSYILFCGAMFVFDQWLRYFCRQENEEGKA